MSIQDIVLKIKGFVGKQRLEKASWALKGLLLAVTGILIGITGFFCGKIAYARTKPADPISVIYPPRLAG